MNFTKLSDTELLSRAKFTVQRERDVTIEVVHILREIERRKLFSDLGYSSLFDYAMGELRYSKSSAYRRIELMRLTKEIPEVEAKVQSGSLILSNVCQATNLFREIKRNEPQQAVSPAFKREILEKLENKSAREGEKILLAMNPNGTLPREQIRQVTPELMEARFLVNADLDEALKNVRALLGQRGAAMTLAELVREMANLSREKLEEKRFGKRRMQAERAKSGSDAGTNPTRHAPTGPQHQSSMKLFGAASSVDGTPFSSIHAATLRSSSRRQKTWVISKRRT